MFWSAKKRRSGHMKQLKFTQICKNAKSVIFKGQNTCVWSIELFKRVWWWFGLPKATPKSYRSPFKCRSLSPILYQIRKKWVTCVSKTYKAVSPEAIKRPRKVGYYLNFYQKVRASQLVIYSGIRLICPLVNTFTTQNSSVNMPTRILWPL